VRWVCDICPDAPLLARHLHRSGGAALPSNAATRAKFVWSIGGLC
jgi:hypothetical protein